MSFVNSKHLFAAAFALALTACGEGGKGGPAARSAKADGSSPKGARSSAPTSSARPTQPATNVATWDPKTTYAVIVGALKFKATSISGWSDKHRKDDELAKLLLARGVPKENLVELLDEKATASEVFAAIEKTAKAAPKGSTLLFYYAGHGGNGKAGEISFVAYDADGTPATDIALDRVEKTIASAFAGGTVLLFADACYSGGLLEVAKNLGKKGYDAAAVTSASASNLSTSNWTFSQALIDALDGDGIADRDGSGAVSIGELGAEVRDAMKYRELQRMGAEYGSVGEGFVLAANNPKRAPEEGASNEYLQAKRGEAWSVARVVGAKDDTLTVEFFDYADKSRAKVRRADTKPLVFKDYAVGAKISVEWKKQWWDASVLKTDNGFHLITYEGYPHFWDEWVLSDRMADRR